MVDQRLGFAQLKLGKCPHCGVAHPTLRSIAQSEAFHAFGAVGEPFRWQVYGCQTCGMGVLVGGRGSVGNPEIQWQFPEEPALDGVVPEAARRYLSQATKNAPDGAVLLCASSVDAMLKAKGYPDGSLYARIDQAVADGVLTDDMGAWAHNVRLHSNDARHADLNAAPPSETDAQHCLDFTRTLAEILFVLTARVTKGKKAAQGAT